MRLTLLKAKELLADHAPADKLEDRINRALERILVSGKFNGGMDRVALTAPYGSITLPRQYRTIEGVKVDMNADGTYAVRPLRNGWYEFLEGKQSLANMAGDYTMDTVRSLGDGHALMRDLPLGGTLQADSSAASWSVTIYGRNSVFMPITRTLTDNTPITNPFTRIERVHKEQPPDDVTNPVALAHFDDDSNETMLAWIEPTEEETFFRRYQDDALTTVAEAQVIAYAKRRHIELTSDQDVLPITNILALGIEMDSIHYLAENDFALSEQHHGAAIAMLNAELEDSHSVDEMPALRFHFPGGAPKLTSGY